MCNSKSEVGSVYEAEQYCPDQVTQPGAQSTK